MTDKSKRVIHLPNQLNRDALMWLAKEYGYYFPEPWRDMDPALIDRRRLRRLLPEAIEDKNLVGLAAPRLAALKSGEAEVIPARFVGNELVIGEGE